MKTKENKTDKLLNFNGKEILFRKIDGEYYVAIKPICEALNVDYIQQFKNLKKHQKFSELLCQHTMVGADNNNREMTCLPEFYIYGWLLEINGKSKEYEEYKWECYKVIGKHFRGTITKRSMLLEEGLEAIEKEKKLLNNLQNSEDYKELMKLKQQKTLRNKKLKQLDKDLTVNQYGMNL